MQDERASTAKAKRAKRDTPPPTPPALVDFMMRGWRPPAKKLPPAVKGAARFAARRRALSQAFPGEALVVPTGHEKIRANDTTFRFRPGSDFYYLTGNPEPDCVLVLWPRGRSGHEHVLYVEPNPGRTSPTFFTDRAKGELWVGPRLGIPESRARYHVDRCEPIAALATLSRDLKRQGIRKLRVVRGVDPDLDARLPASAERDRALAAFISEMRLVKDASEVAAIERAGVATRHALEDVIRALPRAKSERELEGVFNLRARVEGNDVGYGTIVAGGANACILHWTRNDGPIVEGELLLIDAGVEGEGLYTADVTRTLPVRGTFTREQRELYELVVDAQEAAIAAVRPGAAFTDPHRASIEVLTRGLERLGILPMSAEEALRDENQFHKRYTLHNTSHMLGLDVHDSPHAREEKYRKGTLAPGMVLTVEPGLYFQKDDLTVPARYRGIGIRVEDDVLVTARGHRLLTEVPRRAADVERWMKELWARR